MERLRQGDPVKYPESAQPLYAAATYYDLNMQHLNTLDSVLLGQRRVKEWEFVPEERITDPEQSQTTMLTWDFIFFLFLSIIYCSTFSAHYWRHVVWIRMRMLIQKLIGSWAIRLGVQNFGYVSVWIPGNDFWNIRINFILLNKNLGWLSTWLHVSVCKIRCSLSSKFLLFKITSIHQFLFCLARSSCCSSALWNSTDKWNEEHWTQWITGNWSMFIIMLFFLKSWHCNSNITKVNFFYY